MKLLGEMWISICGLTMEYFCEKLYHSFLGCPVYVLVIETAGVMKFLASLCHFRQCHLKIGSTWAERVGQGEMGGCTRTGISCRKALVGTGWPIFCPFVINGFRNKPSHLYFQPFLSYTRLVFTGSLDCKSWLRSPICLGWLKLTLGAVLRPAAQGTVHLKAVEYDL